MKRIVTLCGLGGLLALGACESPVGPKFDAANLLRLSDLQVELEEQTKKAASRHVSIQAKDIELPLTSGADNPPGEREYDFWVWVDISQLKSTKLSDALQRDFMVDVLGAAAKIAAVSYEEPRREGSSTQPRVRDSRSVVKITVRSSDIRENITLIAWFPAPFAEFEMQRDSEIRRLQNRVAELRNVFATGMSGETRKQLREAYLELESWVQRPNPWGEIRTVRVFNADLRTSIIMLSEEEVRDAFGRNFARFFFVGRAYFWNRHADKKLVINTTSLRAKTLFYREADPELATAFLRQGTDEFKRYEYLERHAGLGTRAETTATGITKTELAKLWTQARILVGAGVKEPTDEQRTTVSVAALGPDPAPPKQEEAFDLLHKAMASCQTIFDSYQKKLSGVARSQYAHAFGAPDPMANLISLTADTSVKEQIRNALRALDQRVRQYILDARPVVSPLRQPLPLVVGPERKSFAASPSIHRQEKLAESGYVFRDYYRPMTLNAVLVSLLRKVDEATESTIIKWMESLGVVAASLVGVDAIANEFAKPIFGTSVSIFSGVLVPELRKRLIADIEQYLTNAGTLGLDAQFTLAPLSMKDGYVFFPRGPMFGYGIDEFTINAPSFIVNIDNNDVIAEGRLVERDTEISSGMRSASDQARAALDSGRALRDERTRELVEIEATLRKYRLSNVETEVHELLQRGDAAGANRVLAEFEKTHGPDATGIVGRLKADADGSGRSRAVRVTHTDNDDELRELTMRAASKSVFTAEFRVRLDRRPADNASTLVTLDGVSSDGKPKVKVELFYKKRIWPRKDGEPSTTRAEILFGATADAQRHMFAWHDHLTVRVSINDAENVGNLTYTVRLQGASSDPAMRGTRTISVRLPKVP